MSERWICNRCYTSAEDAATVCPNCGLGRGLPATTETAALPPANAGEETAPGSSTTESVEQPPAQPAPESPVEPAGPEAAVDPVPAPAVAMSGSGNERWVCLRCFASNDGTATACATCGQPRGEAGEPIAGAEWAPAAAPPATQGRQFPWRWVLYGVIVLAVLGASYFFAARRADTGEVTDAGDMSVFDLQVGDCFDVGTDQTEVETVRAIPCEDPHTYEMFWAGEYAADVQPSEDEYMSWLEGNCLPEFEAYVGLDYQESVLYMGSLSPTEESWGNGDRAFSCYLFNDTETPMTGSARGTAQ